MNRRTAIKIMRRVIRWHSGQCTRPGYSRATVQRAKRIAGPGWRFPWYASCAVIHVLRRDER